MSGSAPGSRGLQRRLAPAERRARGGDIGTHHSLIHASKYRLAACAAQSSERRIFMSGNRWLTAAVAVDPVIALTCPTQRDAALGTGCGCRGCVNRDRRGGYTVVSPRQRGWQYSSGLRRPGRCCRFTSLVYDRRQPCSSLRGRRRFGGRAQIDDTSNEYCFGACLGT
jgi:hypothetical protein